MSNNERESVKVLQEAAELQLRKSQDYQNPMSRVRQADHYPRGVNTMIDIVNGKILRIYSVLETMEQGGKINFESVEDSAIDAINYLSFMVAYMRGGLDGQQSDRDIFNRRVTEGTLSSLIPKKFEKPVVPAPLPATMAMTELELGYRNDSWLNEPIETAPSYAR